MARKDKGDFIGGKLHYGGSEKDFKVAMDKYRRETMQNPLVATQWKNRRPICPYGCDEEGQLVEIVVRPEGAVGLYKDSEQLVFTAPMKMQPKPNEKKIVIGPDGEPHLEES
jgi:hypothetical protein